MSSATQTSSASAGATGASGNGGGGSNATNSPLLFFVALGFGVVFTNLWYVKYIYLPLSHPSSPFGLPAERLLIAYTKFLG
jgi:hypothetical protein